MPIKIFNPTRLTKRPFFQKLIDFLAVHDDVNLRQIKAEFSDEKNLERQIEEFVQANLVTRLDKRYRNNFPIFSDKDFNLSDIVTTDKPAILQYNLPFFVDSASQLVTKLENSQIQQVLTNSTNGIALHFSSNFKQTTDTLANYFSHVANNQPLSTLEAEIFQLIGDVNPDYALKYVTTFLLKFAKKELVKNKKPDIFIKTLVLYGYLEQVDEVMFRSCLRFDNPNFETISFEQPHEFIAAQLRQNEIIANFMKI
ncbi:hypothetical protein Hs30E_16880 [Lactococcus hodotermopsidis]|uniref:DUF1803 domain-containing protein n=1 Tax=Pseudolactococcus hodotermopsidis TaxID=2709157 RepID=A0A6A0BH66_9LACT|nr:DUF1803 domain-containing protein [Lactococcus hodotermopsidis]GFH43137.1 hypothetical protein Hs30E_16880 [Lactococcus hodotermopsidis]